MKERFFWFTLVLYKPLLHPPPASDFIVSEDAVIVLKTVSTLALAISRCNHSPTSHPLFKLTYGNTNDSGQDGGKRGHHTAAGGGIVGGGGGGGVGVVHQEQEQNGGVEGTRLHQILVQMARVLRVGVLMA
jgi:hypothetical protein